MVDLFYQPCSHDKSDLKGNGDSNDWNAVLSWVHPVKVVLLPHIWIDYLMSFELIVHSSKFDHL